MLTGDRSKNMSKPKILFFSLAIVFGLIIFSGYYLIFTTKGSNLAVKFMLSRYDLAQGVDFEGISGSLGRGLVYDDFILSQLKYLPTDTTFRAQRLNIYFGLSNFFRPKILVKNGSLSVPGFSQIRFYGSFEEGFYDLNIYSNNLNLGELFLLFGDQELRRISGSVEEVDIYLKGSFAEPELTGTFSVKRITWKDLSLRDSLVNFDLKLEDTDKQLKIFGSVFLKKGFFSSHRAAVIELQEGEIIFRQRPDKPSFDIKATSAVRGVKIKITLKGSIDEPELRLSSSPSLPKQRLLLMLATNRDWPSLDAALLEGEISADIAKDFFDYLVFSEPLAKINQALGVGSISLKYNGQVTGIGTIKDISEATRVSYSLEQMQDKSGERELIQRIGLEHEITNSISLKLKGEVAPEKRNEAGEDSLDGEAVLKFKKEF